MYFSELIRHNPKYVPLFLQLFPLYLIRRRSIMRIYLHREPVISLRRCSWFFPWAPFISSLRYLWRCIAEENASRRAAFANCNLRNIKANVHVQRQSVMKVSIKCRWRRLLSCERKTSSSKNIILCRYRHVFFLVFEGTNVLLLGDAVRSLSFIRVIRRN